MVMFTCNRCSAGLKKSQVENHAFQCGGPSKISLTCHDCLKDFRGKEYESHTSCISEEARYGGKGVVVKEVGKKQNQWCEVVQNVLTNNKSLEPAVYKFLKAAVSLPNIPRKRPQFTNWAKNAMKCFDNKLIDKVFDVLIAEYSQKTSMEQQKSQKPAIKDQPDEPETKEGNEIPNEQAVEANGTHTNGSVKKKKNKREKTDDGSTNAMKEEPMDDSSQNGVADNGDVLKKKKKKKKKKSADVAEAPMEGVEESAVAADDEATEVAQPHAETGSVETQKLSKKERKLLKKKAKFEAEVAEIENFKKDDEEGKELAEEEKPKKNKKRKNQVEVESGVREDDGAKKMKVEPMEVETEEPPAEDVSRKKVKFDWHENILAVLRQSKKDEVSVKKVTKKVIDEYVAQSGDAAAHEKLHAKMVKKLQTCPGVRVLKDKVKLLDSER